MTAQPTLGILAGGGALPLTLARSCQAAGRSVFVVRLRGFADAALAAFPSAEIGIAELGGILDALRGAGVRSVCMAGRVSRPDFNALKPDLRGLRSLASVAAAAAKGDDALLRWLLAEFEREGFAVQGAHEVAAELTLPAGPLGRVAPDAAAEADIARAIAVARSLGALDVGQGAVVCDNLVLAVEAQEGTDAMLARIPMLPQTIRGTRDAPRGVLAKALKPTQEARMDMPVIGAATVEAAAAAGLAGVAGEAGKVLLLDREATLATADRLGLFVFGYVDP